MRRTMIAALLMTAFAVPAVAQGLGGLLKKGEAVKKGFDDLNFTDDEEALIGEDISKLLRDKYGVVQDKAVHKYVALTGMTLAQASTRPNLKWTFVVLDTDGVNAFAAPGGFVHITRGALALMQNEAELADALGHEIGHITKKHTIGAIQKNKALDMSAQASRKDVLDKIAQIGYSMVLENNFDRKQEGEADEVGMTLANKAGYAPAGLSSFLTRLAERNKDQKERSGIFASHQETKGRLTDIPKYIASATLTSANLVAARYGSTINYKPVPISAVAQVAPPTPGAAPAADKPASSSGGKFGMAGLSGLGKEKSGNQTVSSAGSRGLNPDRDAKGGPVKTLIAVTVTAAELAEFKKGISG